MPWQRRPMKQEHMVHFRSRNLSNAVTDRRAQRLLPLAGTIQVSKPGELRCAGFLEMRFPAAQGGFSSNQGGRTDALCITAKWSGECLLRVCAVERRRFPVGVSPTRQPLQPEATGAVMEVTKWLKPLVSVSRYTVTARVCRP